MLGAGILSLSVLAITYLIGTPYGRLTAAKKEFAELQATHITPKEKQPIAPTRNASSDPDSSPGAERRPIGALRPAPGLTGLELSQSEEPNPPPV